MEQVPTETSVTVVPLTVQIGVVVEAKLTVKPELAVAASVTEPLPKTTEVGCVNVIVWLACVTLKLCVTGAAVA